MEPAESNMESNILFSGKIVGTSFEPAKSNLQELLTPFLAGLDIGERGEVLSGLGVKLIHITDNPYDPNAIRVYFEIGNKSWEVGWIPRFANTKILEYGIENTESSLTDFLVYEDKIVGALITVTKKT